MQCLRYLVLCASESVNAGKMSTTRKINYFSDCRDPIFVGVGGTVRLNTKNTRIVRPWTASCGKKNRPEDDRYLGILVYGQQMIATLGDVVSKRRRPLGLRSATVVCYQQLSAWSQPSLHTQ